MKSMGDQPPSQQAPPGGPWPRAVPPYSPPPLPPPPLPPQSQPPQPQPGEGRLLLSRWTKRIAWLGVAATGVFSFVAARSVPGRAATPSPENTAGSQVSNPAGSDSSAGGSTLQPASQLPQPSTRQPYVRSGGS